MKAAVLRAPGAIESHPLAFLEIPRPSAGPGQLLVKVSACGICRTDLHVVEGELPPRKSSIVPGHQIVGTVEEAGEGAAVGVGTRVGVAWLHRTCGACVYCRSGRENLCERAEFTGYSVDGGYAEYALAEASFVYPLPHGFADLQAAPLLCAGIIGYRALKLARVQRGEKLGIYGFGAAGHVAIQVARHLGVEVYVATREPKHQELARRLGAAWAGATSELRTNLLDAAIIFAPAGGLVPLALSALGKGGRLVLGGIHMSDLPSMPYSLLYHERSIQSVANNTRTDGAEFLRLAAEIPIHTQVQVFPLDEANQALNALKHDGIQGAGVLRIGNF